ncbi:hypothetical protein Tco_0812514 [Tanacetum coccineum]
MWSLEGISIQCHREIDSFDAVSDLVESGVLNRDCPDCGKDLDINKKDRRKPDQNDKTEHGNGKDCAKSRQSPKMAKVRSIR